MDEQLVDEDVIEEERKEKVRRVFIFIGVICVIALLVSIPLSWYFVR